MATYKIDHAHSEIAFRVKHMMITNVRGAFARFDASMETDGDDFTTAKISFEAETASISTNNEMRDGHLRSPEFFDAEKFPKLTFVSQEMRRVNADHYKLVGDLTIRDVTKPIELSVEFHGAGTDPYGHQKVGFEIEGSLHRTDFGLTWNAVTEAGSIMVSDEVRLSFDVQMLKQA